MMSSLRSFASQIHDDPHFQTLSIEERELCWALIGLLAATLYGESWIGPVPKRLRDIATKWAVTREREGRTDSDRITEMVEWFEKLGLPRTRSSSRTGKSGATAYSAAAAALGIGEPIVINNAKPKGKDPAYGKRQFPNSKNTLAKRLMQASGHGDEEGGGTGS